MGSEEEHEKQLRFGPYTAARLVGRGGMGVVYRALRDGTQAPVALKVMNGSLAEDPVASERFLREGRLVAQVRHEHVVQVLELGVDAGRPFIAMRYIEGETLAARIARQGPLPLEDIVEIFAPLLAAVAAIHDAGIIHRDLKLANVMLESTPSGGVHPVILDFGISKIEVDSDDSSLTHSHALMGTLRYLAPELMLSAKTASARSDQYALGVMLYECATSQRAFSGSSQYEVMHAVLHGSVRPPSEVACNLPPGFDELVLRAINRNPAERFGSVRALGNALLSYGNSATWARWAREFRQPAPSEVTEREIAAEFHAYQPTFAVSASANRRVARSRKIWWRSPAPMLALAITITGVVGGSALVESRAHVSLKSLPSAALISMSARPSAALSASPKVIQDESRRENTAAPQAPARSARPAAARATASSRASVAPAGLGRQNATGRREAPAAPSTEAKEAVATEHPSSPPPESSLDPLADPH